MQPLTPLFASPLASASAIAQTPMGSAIHRSMSVSSTTSISSAGSTSSTYSRAAEDLIYRLAGQETHAVIHLWSAGNVRLSTGRDLTVPPQEAIELIRAMERDERFEFVQMVDFGHDADDWKISFRRTAFASTPSTPPLSDSE